MTQRHSKGSQLFRVRLTAQQRRAIRTLAPRLEARLCVRDRHAKSIPLSLEEMREIRLRARESLYRATATGERTMWERVAQIMEHSINYFTGIGAIPTSSRVYQFLITLRCVEPLIWRRIQVKDCTLARLHEHIQLAMGWTGTHLHEFDIAGQPYADPELLEETFNDIEAKDSRVSRLREVLPPSGKRYQFLYTYDFGDVWEHDVLFEGCLRATAGQVYPMCLEGERACPPEDIGGPQGYKAYLEALSGQYQEEEDEELFEWPRDFDPEAFDENETTDEMRAGFKRLRS